MPRRKPISTKQRKEELKEKRAIKRGDIPAPAPASSSKTGPKRGRRTTKVRFGFAHVIPGNTGLGTKRLESKFGKLTPEWLERAKFLASTEALKRPIPTYLTILLDYEEIGGTGGEDSPRSRLICPKRPKWRYDMEKKEVEKNEEGLFAKWIAEMDKNVEAWRSEGIVDEKDENDQIVHSVEALQRSPTYFERNLEVWRQLWRVTEISQILMILLDVRAPTVHFPPSLQSYVTTLRPARKIIVVLTKSDLVSRAHVTAWRVYFASRHPEIRVVQVEAYKERATAHDTTANDAKGKKKRRYVDPYIPGQFLKVLVQTMKEVHRELLEPPEWVKNETDQEKRKGWRPKVRESVDWDQLLDDTTRPSVVAPTMEPKENAEEVVEPDSPEEDAMDLRYITVGLIGQPNAGKSSLLNALFGEHKVKASRTPGKTKHFQTLFWTPEIRLVDCPGLVMPNYVPMEMQVLSGILPISQISSIPSCIQHAARFMPLEEVFGLANPSIGAPPVEDKRTWREGTTLASPTKGEQWTAMDIMVAYATKKGWVTAKAGRPDVNRAGNAILRTLAEGRVKWAFWPPGYQAGPEDTKQGIWLNTGVEEDSDEESEVEDETEEEMEDGSETGDDGVEEDSDEEPTGIGIPAGGGRFGALALADGDTDEDEDP